MILFFIYNIFKSKIKIKPISCVPFHASAVNPYCIGVSVVTPLRWQRSCGRSPSPAPSIGSANKAQPSATILWPAAIVLTTKNSKYFKCMTCSTLNYNKYYYLNVYCTVHCSTCPTWKYYIRYLLPTSSSSPSPSSKYSPPPCLHHYAPPLHLPPLPNRRHPQFPPMTCWVPPHVLQTVILIYNITYSVRHVWHKCIRNWN